MAPLHTSSLIAAAGLLGGFAVAQRTGNRKLGGAVFAGAGILAGIGWWRGAGPLATLGLAGSYAGAMGGSHPLAHKLGAWPSVGLVTAGVVLASERALHAARQGR